MRDEIHLKLFITSETFKDLPHKGEKCSTQLITLILSVQEIKWKTKREGKLGDQLGDIKGRESWRGNRRES